jgi:hypothetical protein
MGNQTINFVSVRLSSCIGASPTGRISVKFDVGDFYGNLLGKSPAGFEPAILAVEPTP